MKALTKGQRKMLSQIQAYLKSETGRDGLLLATNECTSLWFVDKIYQDAIGIRMIGRDHRAADSKDLIVNDSICDLRTVYSAAKKGDFDFKCFIESL